MFSKKVFLYFLFFSLPSLVFANTCENDFSAGKILAEFARKKVEKTFEKDLDLKWTKKIEENTKHWTRAEATQFLEFLVHRSGEINTVRHIRSLADFTNVVRFNEFMNKVRFYDRINKDIIGTIPGKDYLEHLVTDRPMDRVKIQQVYQVIERHAGGTTAAYIMRQLVLDRWNRLHNVDPKEMQQVISFVKNYIETHTTIPNTLDNRAGFFRQFLSLPSEQQTLSEIKFNSFSELREFSRLISETLLKKEETEVHFTTERTDIVPMLNLQLIMRIKTLIPFHYFSRAKLRNLQETITILEKYIPPALIVQRMLNGGGGMFSANPKHLQEVIDILKDIYKTNLEKGTVETGVTPTRRNPHTPIREESSLLKIAREAFETKEEDPTREEDFNPMERQETATIVDLPSMNSPRPEVFISYMIRENSPDLLAANPTNLRSVITLLENYYGSKNTWITLLQPDKNRSFQRGFLSADPKDLQKVMDTLNKYFSTHDIITYFLTKNFENISSRIKGENVDPFISTVNILATYINKKDILAQRITELIEDVEVSAEIHDTLKDMSSTSNHRTMQKMLTELPLSEFSPSAQEFQLIFTEGPRSPGSLH